jgi:hypothetical protein
MTAKTATPPAAADVQEHLQLLLVERELAAVEGLAENAAYMTDLDEEIAATRSAYVGAAVTEIATLRAELSGRLQG